MAEAWKDIPGFENWYQVSSRGRVRSLRRVVLRRNGVPYTVRPCVLRPKRHRCGMLSVALSCGRRGECATFYIHRLLAEVFGDQANAA